jgi:hypothetical protein
VRSSLMQQYLFVGVCSLIECCMVGAELERGCAHIMMRVWVRRSLSLKDRDCQRGT